MKKPRFAPRNPLVAAAIQRKAGAHGPTRKALRQAARQELKSFVKQMLSGKDDGSFSRQAHGVSVCLAGMN